MDTSMCRRHDMAHTKVKSKSKSKPHKAPARRKEKRRMATNTPPKSHPAHTAAAKPPEVERKTHTTVDKEEGTASRTTHTTKDAPKPQTGPYEFVLATIARPQGSAGNTMGLGLKQIVTDHG